MNNYFLLIDCQGNTVKIQDNATVCELLKERADKPEHYTDKKDLIAKVNACLKQMTPLP